MTRLFLNPRNILPLIIFFSVLTLGVHIENAWTVAKTGNFRPGLSAHAEESKHGDAPAVSTPAKAEGKGDAKADSKDAKPAEEAKHEDAAPSSAAIPDDASPAEIEVLKQLADRRDELEKRIHDLDSREALIKVAEQRVDQKIKEMQNLRLQLQTMVDQIGGAQSTQLENLVKIYETMKPKDAARIFEALDMPILLGVIQRMKPKSTAPIMAEMAPEKAKEVTVALTKQDQLPKLK